MSDHDLEDLLGRIPVPAYDVRDDVARGTTRLRVRNATLSAAGLVLTATVGTALVLQSGTGPSAAPQYAGRPSASAVPSSTASPSEAPSPLLTPSPRLETELPDSALTDLPAQQYGVLRAWRDVLAEHLGDQVRFVRNQQSGGGALGSKYDWAGGGMLQLMVGRRWDDIGAFVGVGPMQRTTFRGLRARTWSDGTDRLVSVRHEDGTVVSLYASTSFGNNGTSTDTLRLSEEALLDAASDERLRPPG